ncbi:hypothetical protein MICAB_1500015 [Microcystis aeruginosa PCC 9717]|uniref:Uncharacterized protein n=1 Tax=Microcystis aeruginosa PCC 9717 TaxID=1160286 RepID=I4FKA7_MICAE|nr:hypothetical protein MICAB_1500015 [Microcystis aeruginosa PCC 9717]
MFGDSPSYQFISDRCCRAVLLHPDFITNNINGNYTAINARAAVPVTESKNVSVLTGSLGSLSRESDFCELLFERVPDRENIDRVLIRRLGKIQL